MFERYTEKARRVIFFARYEASHYGAPAIDTEHLLLGLVREEKLVGSRWLPSAKPDLIRTRVDAWAPRGEPILTSVDLPLTEASNRVLFHSRDEADRLNSKHIGTEHLLLGLLQEECPAAQLLRELGGDASRLRAQFERDAERAHASGSGNSPLSDPVRSAAAESVKIHGLWWNSDYIYDAVRRCRRHNWHWHKAKWKPRDLVVHRKTGKLSFDLSLAADSENFEVVKGGWKRDHCAVCGWELLESEDLYGTGYTNGDQWLCLECYDKFWQRPDFISGSYSDIT
jgi:hypothetical protein